MLSVLCEHLNIVPATAAQGTLVRNFTVKESFSKWMLVSCGLGQGVWLSNVLSASGFIFKKKTKLFRKNKKGWWGEMVWNSCSTWHRSAPTLVTQPFSPFLLWEHGGVPRCCGVHGRGMCVGPSVVLFSCAAPSWTCLASPRCAGTSWGCSWPTRSARRHCAGSSWSSSSGRMRSTRGSCWPSGRSGSRSRRSRDEGWRR